MVNIVNTPVINNPQPQHVKELDGLRGLAILFVMLFHFTADIPANSSMGRAVLKLCSVGWIGVDLFFVLSGYLITGILLRTKGSPHFFRNFYARRTIRIFPLYYGVLFIIFILLPGLGFSPRINFPWEEQLWFWLYGTNVLIILKGIGATVFGSVMLTHFWTLSVEEHFYLLWPTVVRWANPKKLISIGIGVILICTVARAVMSYFFRQPLASYCLTPFRIDSLIAGAILVTFCYSVKPTDFDIRRFAIGTIATTLPSLIVLFFWRQGLHPHDPLIQVVGYPLISGLSAAAIALAIVAKHDSIGTSFLRTCFLTSLGKYSYGIYIYHVLIWFPLNNWFSAGQLSRITGSTLIGAVLHIFLLSGASFAIAYISWHCYENPFLRLKRFFEYPSKSVMPVFKTFQGVTH